MSHLTELLRTSINDKLRSNSICCLAEAFSPDPSLLVSQERTDEKWSQSQYSHSTDYVNMSKWFYQAATSRIGHEGLFNMCLSMAKQPFVEKRLSAQLYFKSLLQTRWGLECLFEPNRFNSDEAFVAGYLLNRECELEKEGLESKYEMIRLMMAVIDANEEVIRLVGADCVERLRKYVSDGVFMARAQARVAFESN